MSLYLSSWLISGYSMYLYRGVSNAIIPLSINRANAYAKTGLLREAASNNEFESTLGPSILSFQPKLLSYTMRSLFTTAIDRPGTWYCCIFIVIKLSSSFPETTEPFTVVTCAFTAMVQAINKNN